MTITEIEERLKRLKIALLDSPEGEKFQDFLDLSQMLERKRNLSSEEDIFQEYRKTKDYRGAVSYILRDRGQPMTLVEILDVMKDRNFFTNPGDRARLYNIIRNYLPAPGTEKNRKKKTEPSLIWTEQDKGLKSPIWFPSENSTQNYMTKSYNFN